MNRLGNGVPLVHIHCTDEQLERVENIMASLVVLSLTALIIVEVRNQSDRREMLRELRR